MKEVRTAGIVIRSNDYKDNDKMLCILSPEYGKINAIGRGVKKINSKNLPSSEIFAYSEFVFNSKNNRLSLVTASLKESFFDLRKDYEILNTAFAIVEVAYFVAQENQRSVELFELVYYSLSHLTYSDMNDIDIWLVYIIKLLALQGFAPSTTSCSICGKSTYEYPAFSIKYGSICSKCAMTNSGVYIDPLSIEAMRRILALPIIDFSKVVLPDEQRNILQNAISKYYHYHIGGKYKSILLSDEK